MSLREPLIQHPLARLVEEATPWLCDELERWLGRRTSAGPVHEIELGPLEASKTFPRLTVGASLGFLAADGATMTFAVVMRERDAAALGALDGLTSAAAEALRRALEGRTCIEWSLAEVEPLADPLTLFSGHTQDVAVVLVEGCELFFVGLSDAADALARLDDEVVRPLRPRLVEAHLPTLETTQEIDDAVVGALPVSLGAVLATRGITVGQLTRLRTGDALKLDAEWDRLVRVSVGDKVVASGELIVVNGRWGVLVHEVAP